MNVPEYHLECGPQCSLREGQPWSKEASDLLASGLALRAVIARAAAAKAPVKLNLSNTGNHKKHIVVHEPDPDAVAPAGPKATNIEIIETIIQKGFANSKNWRPTIGDTMKAMDMWFRLTQGNPFDELLDTLAAAATGDEDAPDESPDAIGLPEDASGPEEDE